MTIPDVVGAVREAWLAADRVKEQIHKVAAREEIPAWPVLVQWEISTLYTGWSTVERTLIETPRVGDRLGGNKVALYDVERFGEEGLEHKGITHFALKATSVLGARHRIFWRLEGDVRYVLSTEIVEDDMTVEGWLS